MTPTKPIRGGGLSPACSPDRVPKSGLAAASSDRFGCFRRIAKFSTSGLSGARQALIIHARASSRFVFGAWVLFI